MCVWCGCLCDGIAQHLILSVLNSCLGASVNRLFCGAFFKRSYPLLLEALWMCTFISCSCQLWTCSLFALHVCDGTTVCKGWWKAFRASATSAIYVKMNKTNVNTQYMPTKTNKKRELTMDNILVHSEIRTANPVFLLMWHKQLGSRIVNNNTNINQKVNDVNSKSEYIFKWQ